MSEISVHFSSTDETWETPQSLYNLLHAEFDFTLDVCATEKTAKCTRFFTPETDGLAHDWTLETCWMNPPYGRVIKHWVEKAYRESSVNGATVVCLIPSRTDTNYWLRGRVRFKLNGKESNVAPFPSAIVVFRPFGLFDGSPRISALNVADL